MMFSYASSAHDRGIQVIIAGAGGAAHLPGKLLQFAYKKNLQFCFVLSPFFYKCFLNSWLRLESISRLRLFYDNQEEQ